MRQKAREIHDHIIQGLKDVKPSLDGVLGFSIKKYC